MSKLVSLLIVAVLALVASPAVAKPQLLVDYSYPAYYSAPAVAAYSAPLAYSYPYAYTYSGYSYPYTYY